AFEDVVECRPQFVLVAAGDRDVGARLGEAARHGLAESFAAAGDEGGFAGEVEQRCGHAQFSWRCPRGGVSRIIFGGVESSGAVAAHCEKNSANSWRNARRPRSKNHTSMPSDSTRQPSSTQRRA